MAKSWINDRSKRIASWGIQIRGAIGIYQERLPVAKERMICPFSKRLCEECALYRGRHYHLCFCQRYRGYLGKPGEFAKENPPFVPGARSNGKFEIPSIIPTSAIDPFVTDHESHQKEV